MSLSVDVVWDGSVFRPETVPDLPVNSRHTLPLSSPVEEKPAVKRLAFLDIARAAKLKGPPDYSTRWEEYLDVNHSDET